MITLKQAAEHTGKTKATVLKQIQKGRIRAEKTMLNEWRIDVGSLFQVYPPLTMETPEIPQCEPQGNTNFEHEIALLKEKNMAQQTLIDGLKADKDFLQGQLQMSSRLLENMRVKATEKPIQRKEGFLAGLLGKVR